VRRGIPKARAKPKSARCVSQSYMNSCEIALTSNLEVTLLVDEQVLGFEIAMKNPMSVTVVETFDELEGEFLGARVSSAAMLPPSQSEIGDFGFSNSLAKAHLDHRRSQALLVADCVHIAFQV
jgi:hypothetical protein